MSTTEYPSPADLEARFVALESKVAPAAPATTPAGGGSSSTTTTTTTTTTGGENKPPFPTMAGTALEEKPVAPPPTPGASGGVTATPVSKA